MTMLPAASSRLALWLAIAAVTVWLALNRDRFDPALIESTIHDFGLLASLGHVVLFALGTILFVPGAIFGLVGGALFGPSWGAVLNLTGATLGATAAFLVARYAAADWVRRKAGSRLDRLMAEVEAEGWRFIAFVRLVPLFPFNLTNYALGLTRISLKHYVLASLVCMMPGAVAYAWLGHAGREAAAGNTAAIRYGLIALALLAATTFLPRLVRRLRGQEQPKWIEADELASRLKESRGIALVDVRGADEFTGPLGHIADAANLPVSFRSDWPRSMPSRTGRSFWSAGRTSARRLRQRCFAMQVSAMSGCFAEAWSSGIRRVCPSIVILTLNTRA